MDFDVAVVGAGPAGCLAARNLAREGLQVGLFDASPREKLGKRIVVEAEEPMFARLGVAAPSGDEIPYHPDRLHVFSPRRRRAFTVDRVPVVAVFLDRLARRMLRDAEAAGARFFGRYRAKAPVVEGDVVRGAAFVHDRRKEEVRARLVIDATGFDASLVRGLDPELGFGFADDARDVVCAANAYHRIEPGRAEEAVRQGLHGDDELWATVGLYGPYSTEFSHLSIRNRRAYILVGHKANFQGPPIEQLVDGFRQRQGYYGKRLHGGKGWIRISHTLDRLVCDGFMVIGEAASQVIPLNGSGVASGMVAADLAARAAATALRNGGARTAALWPYAVEYQRGRGASLASLNALRLLTETLSREQVSLMLESGVSGPEDVIRTATPHPMGFSPGALPRRLKGLARHPGLLRTFARNGPKIGAVLRHHRGYPGTHDAGALSAWSRRSRQLFWSIS